MKHNFAKNKKILNLCFRWHIWRNYIRIKLEFHFLQKKGKKATAMLFNYSVLSTIPCNDFPNLFWNFKTHWQISGFFGIKCVSLVEVTVQNFRLLFLRETDKSITTNCDNEINKLLLNIIVWYILHNKHEIM